MNSTELKQYRKKEGKTQKELADMIGVNQSQISRWERGAQKIPTWVDNIVACFEKVKNKKKAGKS